MECGGCEECAAHIFEGDGQAPPGSWIAHRVEGNPQASFWRNNATGEITHDLFFCKPATGAMMVRAHGPPKQDEDQQPCMPQQDKTWFGHPWMEIWHRDGSRHWVHRETGRTTDRDPLR